MDEREAPRKLPMVLKSNGFSLKSQPANDCLAQTGSIILRNRVAESLEFRHPARVYGPGFYRRRDFFECNDNRDRLFVYSDRANRSIPWEVETRTL